MVKEISEWQALKQCLQCFPFYFVFILFSAWGLWHSPWEIVYTLPFVFAIVSLTVIDLKHMILPDIITLPFLIMGIFLHGFLHNYWFMPILGAAIAFGVFFSLFYITYKLKGQPSLGFGDVKFFAMLGAWLGVTGLPLVLLWSSLFALIYIFMKAIFRGGFSNRPFPYGPFLALGGWLTFLYHNSTWQFVFKLRQQLIQMIG